MPQQTMYPAIINSPQTELNGAIDAIVTTITVLNGAALPAAPNQATIGTDESAETILYATKVGNTLSGVTRGFQGTAKNWSSGNKVARMFTEHDYATLKGNVEDLDTRQVSHLADYVRNPAYGPATGAVNAYTFSAMAATALVDGMSVYLDNVIAANTGASTFNWSGLGAISIRDAKGAVLTAGKMPLNCIVGLRYNASVPSFQLLGEGGEYGNATAAQVLAPNTIGLPTGVVPGTMPDRGSVGTQNLASQNAQYTIPAGYHNGGGLVQATYPGYVTGTVTIPTNSSAVVSSSGFGVGLAAVKNPSSSSGSYRWGTLNSGQGGELYVSAISGSTATFTTAQTTGGAGYTYILTP